jgi:hypothetical protein
LIECEDNFRFHADLKSVNNIRPRGAQEDKIPTVAVLGCMHRTDYFKTE